MILRELRHTDCEEITRAFTSQGWNKPLKQYLDYLELQERKERDIIIAELDGAFAGYLTIKWKSDYRPFAIRNIPEIVDFNVLKKYQRQRIGTQLMDEAETRIKKFSNYAGIGFGLYEDYGAAQILYINRGYIPDGNGIIKDCVPLSYGDQITIDDGIVLYLTKRLV